MAAALFPPWGVVDGDASSSQLYASDALCPHAPGGLYAPAGRAGDAFTVAIAVWTLGEGEGAGGIIMAGKGGTLSNRLGRASAYLVRVLRSPGREELPKKYHILMALLMCSRGVNDACVNRSTSLVNKQDVDLSRETGEAAEENQS